MASIASSLMSGASPAGLFQIINFMQLYMFLILLKIYLPQKVIDFILSNSIFNLNFGLLGMDSVPMLKDFLKMLRIDQSDSTLEKLSVESMSTFYNLFTHLLVLLLVVIAHLIFWLIKST